MTAAEVESVMLLVMEYGELRSLATQQSNSRYAVHVGDTEKRADAVLTDIRACLTHADGATARTDADHLALITPRDAK